MEAQDGPVGRQVQPWEVCPHPGLSPPGIEPHGLLAQGTTLQPTEPPGQGSPRRVVSGEGSGLFLLKQENSGSLAEQSFESCRHLIKRREWPVEEGNPQGLGTPRPPQHTPSYCS